jgi:hypothetical protein
MKKIAILQSNYIPWKGYFDMIAVVDELILYDDMQFTKNDWRNRNKIKTPKGVEWLSIPVGQNINRRIREVVIPNGLWQKKHWKTLEANYIRAPHFKEISTILEPIYLHREHAYLSSLNRALIEAVCGYLGISTKISNSWDYELADGKTERLADLCAQAGGTEYISGPAAKDYIEEHTLSERGIKLIWFDYAGYPEYPQLWGKFIHEVTVLDLLFNCGKEAPMYMKFKTAETTPVTKLTGS